MTPPSGELCFALLLIAPLMLVGYTVIHMGFGKARGAAYAGLSSLVVISIASLTFWAVGHPCVAAVANWIHHANATPTPPSVSELERPGLSTIFEVYAISFAALIPLGAAADRWRLRSLCISTFLFAAISFPLFVHWSWDGGWLSSAAFLRGAGLFDPAGAASIHVLGALTALSMSWILGPRRKKYPIDGPPAAIPGHNMAFVLPSPRGFLEPPASRNCVKTDFLPHLYRFLMGCLST